MEYKINGMWSMWNVKSKINGMWNMWNVKYKINGMLNVEYMEYKMWHSSIKHMKLGIYGTQNVQYTYGI